MNALLGLPPDGAGRIVRREAFTVRHDLVNHPLLTIPALAELADQLSIPTAIVERFGDPSFVGPHKRRGRGGPSPGELVRTIATNGCWADLRHIEQVRAYRDLVDELLDAAFTGSPRLTRQSVGRHGFVFITAPGKVTPPHSDPEYNFLLQVRGTKTVGIAPLAALSEAELGVWRARRGYEGGYRRAVDTTVPLEPFRIEPGVGVHIPAYAIHTVHNGPDVSISLSIACRTRGTRREYLMHALERHLRRLRLMRAFRPSTRPAAPETPAPGRTVTAASEAVKIP